MVQILLVLRILGKKNATELDPIHCNTMPFLISGPTLAISNTLNFVWSNPTLQRTYQESRLLRATILSCVDFYVECLLWIGYKCFCRKTEAFMCVENFSQHFVSPWILDICCCSRVLQVCTTKLHTVAFKGWMKNEYIYVWNTYKTKKGKIDDSIIKILIDQKTKAFLLVLSEFLFAFCRTLCVTRPS